MPFISRFFAVQKSDHEVVVLYNTNYFGIHSLAYHLDGFENVVSSAQTKKNFVDDFSWRVPKTPTANC